MIGPEFEARVKAMLVHHRELRMLAAEINRGRITIFIRQGRIEGATVEKRMEFQEDDDTQS